MKVVIIDDEPLISDKLKRIMETGLRGMHTVCAFTDAQTALDYIEQEKPGVILTDIRMPGITGIDLAKQINQMDYGAKIVFLTGYAEFEYARYGIEYKVSTSRDSITASGATSQNCANLFFVPCEIGCSVRTTRMFG